MKILLVAGAIGFLYALIYKPEYVAVLLFTLVIADLNFDLKGLPLNSRAIVCLSLFGRILFDKVPGNYSPFMALRYTFLVLAFIVYSLLVSWANDLLDFSMFKEFLLTFICAYCGYYFYLKKGDYSLFKTALVLAGLSCMGDLIYTYVHAGTFPVQRIIGILTHEEVYANHNYFGFICGVCFIFLLQDFLNSRVSGFLNLVLLLLMFFGVLMSTSRSTLLLIFLLGVILIINSMNSKGVGKRIYNLILISIGCVAICLFLFESLHSLFNIDSDFIEKITARLIDEPMAVINKQLGNNYDVQSLDSMEWRGEASNLAYDVFMSLSFKDQLFGLGYGAFLMRDFGHGYDAHNGYLRIMIEGGMIGFVIYFWLIFVLTVQVMRQKRYSPLFTTVIFFILYTASHNNEMIAAPAFIVIGSLIGELEYVSVHEGETADNNAGGFALS